MPILEVNGLVCTLRATSIAALRAREKAVLKGVTFIIEEDASLALIGESGSGKTTLARCLVGLEQPDAGTITFSGVNIFPHTANRRLIGLDMQMLFQGSNAAFDPCLAVGDSLLEAINARGTKGLPSHAEAQRLITSVGLDAICLERFPRELSGGELQRVALARVLAVAPRLLILDEPMSALDALTSAHLLHLLRSPQAERKFSILYITHDLHLGFSFCNHVAILHDGMIVESGTPEEIRRSPRHTYTAQLLRDSRLIPAHH